MRFIYQNLATNYCHLLFCLQVQTTTMCISVSLSGFVVLGCMFAPKVHIIMFQPQKNVTSHRLNLNRFSVSGAATTYASHGRLHAVTSFLKRPGLEHHLPDLFFNMSLPNGCFEHSIFSTVDSLRFHFCYRAYISVCFLYFSAFCSCGTV